MNTTYFCYPSAFSLLYLNHCLEKHKLPIHSVVFSGSDGFEKGQPAPFHKVVAKTIKESGMDYTGYELCFSMLTDAYMALQPKKKGLLKSFKQLAEDHDLTFFYSKDFNSDETIDFLNSHNSHLGLSAFNNQLFRAPILDYFNTAQSDKQGLYNIHPALLPNYRGAEPIIPALLNGESQTGVTLHSVNAGLDEGDIHFQQAFDIHPDDSVFSINHKAWGHGAALTAKLFKQLSKGELLESLKQETLTIENGYCSFPSKHQVKQLSRLSVAKQLITWRHFKALMADVG